MNTTPTPFPALLDGCTPLKWTVGPLHHPTRCQSAINSEKWAALCLVNHTEGINGEPADNEGNCNAQLIARCNPATMRKVWDNLEEISKLADHVRREHGNNGYLSEAGEIARTALRLLNGEEV